MAAEKFSLYAALIAFISMEFVVVVAQIDIPDCDQNAQIQIDSSYKLVCVCKDGFTGNGTVCQAFDKCLMKEDNNCDANAICINKSPGYDCQCIEGFDGDGFACKDIDECEVVECAPTAECVNTPGSYQCVCPDGQTGDGRVRCEDAGLRCPDESLICSKNAECSVNFTTLAFYCKCRDGFVGNGIYCTEIDPCRTPENNNCHIHADCVNTQEGYNCSCRNGFSGDGAECTDVDECETGRALCSPYAECVNTEPGYVCLCLEGYVGDGYNCTWSWTTQSPVTTSSLLTTILRKSTASDQTKGTSQISVQLKESATSTEKQSSRAKSTSTTSKSPVITKMTAVTTEEALPSTHKSMYVSKEEKPTTNQATPTVKSTYLKLTTSALKTPTTTMNTTTTGTRPKKSCRFGWTGDECNKFNISDPGVATVVGVSAAGLSGLVIFLSLFRR